MSSLRGRCRRSKKAIANPYAGRGLDKFALVSAELEAKREKLAAQLDTPLSMVKFALGSHNKWIPIVLSRSTKKGSHAPKKKSTGLIPENKLGWDGKIHKGGLLNEDETYVAGLINEDKAHLGSEDNLINEELTYLGGFINGNRAYLGDITDKQRTQLSGFINENITPLGGFISAEKTNTNLALLNGLSTQEKIHIDSLYNEDEAHLDGLIHKDKTTLGSLLGVQRNDLGEIIETFSEVEHIPAHDGEAKAKAFRGRSVKRLMGPAWVVSKASTLASNIIFLRRHTKSMGKDTASAEKAPSPKGEEAHTPLAATVSSSPSPLEKTPASSPFQAQLLPLPSPPARVKTASNSKTTDQAAIAEMMEDTSSALKGAVKQHRKCKARGFLKMRSAPSTPRDSREPQKLFTAASMLPETHGLNDQAAHTDVKEERLIVQKTTNRQNVLSRSRFSRVSTAEKTQKERARRVGQALAAIGLVLSLSGLMMGYISAILGVVCWWYVLPGLRKAVGDKPTVRSHHHSHDTNNNTKPLDVQPWSNKAIKEGGSGKYDLQSHEYKKKVIMEGFLDRGRRSNA